MGEDDVVQDLDIMTIVKHESARSPAQEVDPVALDRDVRSRFVIGAFPRLKTIDVGPLPEVLGILESDAVNHVAPKDMSSAEKADAVGVAADQPGGRVIGDRVPNRIALDEVTQAVDLDPD